MSALVESVSRQGMPLESAGLAEEERAASTGKCGGFTAGYLGAFFSLCFVAHDLQSRNKSKDIFKNIIHRIENGAGCLFTSHQTCRASLGECCIEDMRVTWHGAAV